MASNELYPEIPPTRLRNRDEEFLTGANHPFWVWMADQFFYRMIENRFFSLRMKGEENFEKRNKNYANIIYAPHTNWWDGTVGYNLCRRVFKTTIRMMIEELNRFPIMSKAGAFAVNKKSAQASMRALQYSVDFLKDPDISLWIFPQGIIRPPNFRPVEFQSGMAYIAENCVKKYGGINLIPVAVNYTFLREDKPEVIVDVGEPICLQDKIIDRKALTNKLEKDFEVFCNMQMQKIFSGQLEDYKMLFQTKLPWHKKLEHRLKKIDLDKLSAEK